MRALALALAASLAATPVAAQEVPNLMIVFDASGSMWGQIRGRAKIELAREALSSVLSEADPAMQIGMIAYGHRVRGQCSDIELVVPMGGAARTVPQMLAFANRVNPRGMTPLTDSVLMAAQGMGYTEQAATVVLVTDGIETCAGDPCALGRMLAAQGIDFRAHVVGFDLTDAEQRQVSCLAEETGGLFLAANDADSLRDALARTLAVDPGPVAVMPQPEPEPATLPRRVDLILRDVAGGPVLTGRPFRGMDFVPLDESAEVTGRLDLSLNPGPRTGTVELRPGRYTLMAERSTDGRAPIRIALPVEIPEGAGPHTLDLVIAARLRVNAALHAGQPMPERSGRLPALAGQGWAVFEIHPVIDGAIDPAIDYGGINSRDVALPPGDYFIRGYLDRHFARERLVRVEPGVTTTVDFDLGAVPVTVDLRDGQGQPVEAFDLRAFDLDAAEAFVGGAGRSRGQPVPLYLPEGAWRIEAAARSGDRRPATAWVRVSPGAPQALTLTAGTTSGTPPEDGAAQCLDTHGWHGCVVETVTPVHMVRHLGLNGRAVEAQVAPRYTGTWQTQDRMMLLVQEGRRVWGEVHVNGGIGLVWGHVAPDGLTLRGAMDRSSNPRGAMELRIDAHADTLLGMWDHSIGRMGSPVAARRLSGAVPPLTRATGTEDDLRLDQRSQPWAPADSAAFAAFMAPAQAPASLDTGEDIEAMQRFAPPAGFTGTWSTNHDVVSLMQDAREVHGHYRGRTLWGQVSADGTHLRGVWDDGANRWGLFEFRLDAARMGFAGAWGTAGDADLRGGAWTGTRRSWLLDPPAMVTPRSAALEPRLEGFFAPVRDPDLPDPADPVPDLLMPRLDQTERMPDLIPSALAGFPLHSRFDFAHPGGSPAVSFIFTARQPGGQVGSYETGFVWLRTGWCGPDCDPEILPLGGPEIDEVFNPAERLVKGGVFPGLDLSALGILAFQGDDSDWPRLGVRVHVLTAPYDESTQLGRDGERIARTFGPFIGGPVEGGTLADWPQPDPTAAPVGVGTLPATLAPGIYAVTEMEPGVPLPETLRHLTLDGSRIARDVLACATRPHVVHPDGLIALRELNAMRAASGGAPYSTASFLRCEQNGPMADCRAFSRPLSDSPGTPDRTFSAQIVPGLPGGFVLAEAEGRGLIFRNCLAPDGALSVAELAPSGRRMVDHIADREDGGQSPVFDATGLVVGVRSGAGDAPAPAPMAATPDYAALAGLYGDARGDCAERLVAVRADGTLAVWQDLPARPGAPRLTATCDAAGICQIPGAPPGGFATFQPTAEGFQLCQDGDCGNAQRFAACPAGQPAPDLRALILGTAPAKPTAPAAAPDFIPPGIWLSEAPWSDPIPDPGTPEFRLACLDAPEVVFPDRSLIGLTLHEGVAGPEYAVNWGEECRPSGDAAWPFACIAEDANVAAGGTSTTRMRIDGFGSHTVGITILTEGESAPTSILLHACLRGDGGGIDLDASAEGRALARAIAGLGRGPVPRPAD